MKVLFACGGTAGHVNPALATAQELERQDPTAEILFVGNPKGMEARLVKAAKYRFAPVDSKGFYRSLSPKAMVHNLSAVYCTLAAGAVVKKILDDFRPDVVMGTGGYVSGPVLRTAAKLGYKTITHEQNAFPGVTTKLLAQYVDKILLAVPEAKNFLPKGKNYMVVGNPVRAEFGNHNPKESRQALSITDGRMVIVSFGGSLGAQRVNEAISHLIAWHCKKGRIHHIHATGQYGVHLLPQLLEQQGIHPADYPWLDIREYIDDMSRCLAAADLVISRAGAITLSELQVAGKASILIPSPNVAENHQYHNAMVLQNHNAAIVVEEKDLTGERLCQLVESLLDDPARLLALSKAAWELSVTDSAAKIVQQLFLLHEPPKTH